MIVRAVGDDLGVLVGQQLRSKFLDAFGRDVQRTGDMRFTIAFGRKRLDHRDLFLVKFGFQVLGRNSPIHRSLLRIQSVFHSIVSRVADRLEREKVARVPGEPFEGLDNVIIFVDELNKFASSDMGKAHGIKRQIIEIAARGRSIGLVLMGAQQFASSVDKEVFGNCSTYFVGRSEFIELEHKAYRWVSRDLQYLVSTLPKGKLLMKHAFFNRPVFIEFPRPLHTWGEEDIRRFEESATAPAATLMEGDGQFAFKRLRHLVSKLGSVNAKELFESTSEIKKAGIGSSTFIDMWRCWVNKGQYKNGDESEKRILERALSSLEKLVADKHECAQPV